MYAKINNFFDFQNKNSKIRDYQDLDHIDGVSISTISANLYNIKRDDLVLFYFRKGANSASVYTQSQVKSENIRWNLTINQKRVRALLINTRNANALTGKSGYASMKALANDISEKLTAKQKIDEEKPVKIKSNDIMFACTGTIGEKYPLQKIQNNLENLIEKIKYTQNKYIWVKAGMGILTTDTRPKMAMEECKIGNTVIKIYGIAKGAGMIQPNLATTLCFLFTDANIPSSVLKKILTKNMETTFNAITCDSDTSTNDMVSIFATSSANNSIIKNSKDKKLNDFQDKVHKVLLNLAKSVVSDGEGASKFISVSVNNCKNDKDAKKIAFSIANSPLVKTAIAGEDPNWGRIIMAVGKANIKLKLNRLSLYLGDIRVMENGNIYEKYKEIDGKEYMKNKKIDITVDLGLGSKNFTAYTMDLTSEYIKINSDYRS